MSWKLSELSKSLLQDLNFQTALLESVSWDETQFSSLVQYLNKSLSNSHLTPEELLENIRNEFGESAHLLIKQTFVDIYIENGFYVKSEDDYEH